MKKFLKKRFIIPVSIVLVLIIGLVFGVDFAFDKIMDAMINTSKHQTTQQQSNVATDNSNKNSKSNKADAQKSGSSASTSTSGTVTSQKNKTNADSSSFAGDMKNGKFVIPKGPLPKKKWDSGAVGCVKEKVKGKTDWNITSKQLGVSINSKKIEKFKNEASFSTKAQIVQYVLSKFSPSEISYGKKLVAGGVTYADKKVLSDMVYSRFSKQEIQDLIKKYNL